MATQGGGTRIHGSQGPHAHARMPASSVAMTPGLSTWPPRATAAEGAWRGDRPRREGGRVEGGGGGGKGRTGASSARVGGVYSLLSFSFSSFLSLPPFLSLSPPSLSLSLSSLSLFPLLCLSLSLSPFPSLSHLSPLGLLSRAITFRPSLTLLSPFTLSTLSITLLTVC